MQLIGADSYTFDGAWFRDEMDYCLKCQQHCRPVNALKASVTMDAHSALFAFACVRCVVLSDWLGHRPPSAVCLSDGWKCSRCDYQDVCDQRVVKYERVGRLILPPATVETPAGDATTAAAASAVESEGAGSASKKSKSDALAAAPALPVSAAS